MARVTLQRGTRTGAVDDRVKLGDYFEQRLAARQHDLAPSSLYLYRDVLKRMPAALVSLPVKDVRRGHIKLFLGDLLREGYAPKTVLGALGAVRAVLSAAVDDELLQANPASGLARSMGLRVTPEVGVKALTRPQLQLFLGEARERGWDVFLPLVTLAWTGLRLGELCGLQEPDVDLEDHVLRIGRQVAPLGTVARLKTMGSRRSVDMATELETLLRKHVLLRRQQTLAGYDQGRFLFLPAEPWSGVPVKAFQERLRMATASICKAVGLEPHTPHHLRHTFATQLLEAGRSPQYVQQQLGHSTIKVTVDTYGSWIRRRDREAVDDLALRTGGGQMGLDLTRTGEVLQFKAGGENG